MTIYTTLNKIRACSPCGMGKNDDYGFRKLLNFLGKETSDDEPLKFSIILESNGVDDAYWCLRSVADTHKKEIRLLVADIAERVLPAWENWARDNAPKYLNAPSKAIQASRGYANGKISEKELVDAGAAWAAARDAAGAAAWAERKVQGKLLIKYFG